MSNDRLSLGSEFPVSSEQDWLALVDKVLKGADFDKTLVTKTLDDIAIQPLYASTAQHAAGPGQFPYTRAVSAQGQAESGWQIAQRYTHPSLEVSNQQILSDLERGVTRLRLVMNSAACNSKAPLENSEQGDSGIGCFSVDDMTQLFSDIKSELVPVDLNAGSAFYEYALTLLAFYEKQGVAPEQIVATLGADPGAALAEYGSLPASIEETLSRLVTLAEYCNNNLPNVRAVSVSTAVYHNAGATHAQEIALALASAVTYLRAMTDAGMSVSAACRQISFFISVDTDYFQSIAKLRSLRQLWAEVCRLCGADDESARISLHVDTSTRMLSQRDPWVNMLRSTIAASAAAIGGAESVATESFDIAASGQSSSLGRRISRNTQLLLQEESSIHRVVDPAGGSWFIESHTAELSQKAWAWFQDLEKAGGLFKALENGTVQTAIEQVRTKRMDKIAKRRQPLTGVSEFANLDESPLDPADVNKDAVISKIKASLTGDSGNITKTSDIQSIKQSLADGVSTLSATIALQGEPFTLQALPSVRLASEFESLRDASDRHLAKHGRRPCVFLVTLGIPAQFNARAGFTGNFFAAGGIELEQAAAGLTAEEAAAAWKDSGLKVAVLCSADNVYEASGSEYITALRNAGAEYIVVAGKALIDESDLQIHLASNTLEILSNMHQILEVENNV